MIISGSGSSSSSSSSKRKLSGFVWPVDITDPESLQQHFGESFKSSLGPKASPLDKAVQYAREGMSAGFYHDDRMQGEPERSHPSNTRAVVPSFATIGTGGLYVPQPAVHKMGRAVWVHSCPFLRTTTSFTPFYCIVLYKRLWC
jgi:hypothetical protein